MDDHYILWHPKGCLVSMAENAQLRLFNQTLIKKGDGRQSSEI
jgi:hypothetical protein